MDWSVQPALQAVAGDDAALIAYRDQHLMFLVFHPAVSSSSSPKLAGEIIHPGLRPAFSNLMTNTPPTIP